jgi:hypothetical protein
MDRVEITPDSNPKDGQQTPPPAAAGDQGTQNQQQNDQRPAWLPEKFKTAEDLAKAYSELEKKQSQGGKPAQQQAAPPAQKAEDQKPPPAGDDQQQQQTSTSPFQKFHEEFAQSGELSQESYAELEKLGVSKAVVDQYISGREATLQAQLSEFHNAVGGKENYQSMAEWAMQTLAEDEKAAYNRAVQGNDPIQVKWAIQGLYARFEKENGVAPSVVIQGRSPASGSVKPFGSLEELTTAMSDARYKAGDTAFHKEVEKRLAISNL